MVQIVLLCFPSVEVTDDVVTHISTRPHIESGDVIVLQSVTEPVETGDTLDPVALREQCALLSNIVTGKQIGRAHV